MHYTKSAAQCISNSNQNLSSSAGDGGSACTAQATHQAHEAAALPNKLLRDGVPLALRQQVCVWRALQALCVAQAAHEPRDFVCLQPMQPMQTYQGHDPGLAPRMLNKALKLLAP
jgi:hypothetical protein